MAEEIKEIDLIFEHIKAKENFLLSGGAGSGKTYSLVEVVNRIFETNSQARVACITYTNVAVKQINDRVKFENLRVSTIHDFLWDSIKSFQKNIKSSLFSLIKDEKISDSSGEILELDYFNDKTIDYKDWKRLKNGEVSHDEIICIAEHLFSTYPLLADILIDKFDFILIDEYQDTSLDVVMILFEHLRKSKKKNIIGFFGDSMQAIYPDVVGDIQKYVNCGFVKEVIKKDNRRNPQLIIDLANKLRTDSITQKSAEDKNAPNYQKVGNLKFLYSDNNDVEAIKNTIYFQGWDFKNSKETKELYLTHNLIAPKAGFLNLMAIYDKERIVDFKNDILKRIKEENIEIDANDTFGEVIGKVGLSPTGVKAEFISQNSALYEEAKKYKFEVFKRIYLDKDQLIGNKKGTEEEERRKGSKRDALIRHLFHIQECIFFYEHKKFNQFIRATGFHVSSIQSKIDLKKAIETLKGMKENTIEAVIEFADVSGLWTKG